ncbi:RNA polymerase sigma-70 factor [Larkinella terrae]|uniref:RNA polymerase sigma-70 factor n=2 Tax=Larkinella terrae TaxID=2025311 RepID=A0A7K0EN13_9BACT|nr:RNA polymerase sigma-70 factor [Larkinella terrae]
MPISIKNVMMKRHYQHEEDIGLFQRMQQDDPLAFEEIYNRYFLKLSNTAFKRLQDREMTEEIVQELFVNLWLKRHRLPELKHPESYLQTLLRNSVIDWFRAQARQDGFAAELLAQPDRQTVNATEQHILYADLQRAYESTIGQLPEKCRQVYALHQQGRSVTDIADQLQIAPKTVESHLLKAHQTLRHVLKDYSAVAVALFNLVF